MVRFVARAEVHSQTGKQLREREVVPVEWIQRYVREHPAAEGSEEMLILRAMTEAWHSIFSVRAVEPGAGVLMEDVLRGGERFVHDIGFSQTARIGAGMAARLHSVGDITMTTGAALPVSPQTAVGLHAKLKPYVNPGTGFIDFRDPQHASQIALKIIRTCVRAGASSQIAYADLPAGKARRESMDLVTPIRSTKIGRNDPCPCGSGKKHKMCCRRQP
jgi:hypothetical protein